MNLEDDSLEGSVIILKNSVIKEPKSIYKSGVEHRFHGSPEGRFKAGAPLIKLFKKSNKWRSVADIVDETGMAERTIRDTCSRFIKHEIFEESRNRYTRLYRLVTKSKNGTRTNPKKYENHKKRQSRTNR